MSMGLANFSRRVGRDDGNRESPKSEEEMEKKFEQDLGSIKIPDLRAVFTRKMQQ